MATHLITGLIFGGIFFLVVTDIILIVMAHFLKKDKELQNYYEQSVINQQNYWMREINKDPELTYTNARVTL